MLASIKNYTEEEVVESLDIFIEAYFDWHKIWFGNGELLAKVDIKNVHLSNLVKFTRSLHGYVFNRKYDLTGTDFLYAPGNSYPHCDAIEGLKVAVDNVFYFWQSFLANDYIENIYLRPEAAPFTTLAIDAYMRCRADFGSGQQHKSHDFVWAEDRAILVDKDLKGYSTFTLGEVAYLSGLDLDKVRTGSKIPVCGLKQEKIVSQNPPSLEAASRKVRRKKDIKQALVEVEFPAMSYPDNLINFFHGKTESGTAKRLVMHSDVINFLAVNGNYEPCIYFVEESSKENIIPDYSDSSKIYLAMKKWLSRKRNKSMKDFMAYINAGNRLTKSGITPLEEKMADGSARLSLPLVARINNFMLGGSPALDEGYPFSPLLDCM